MLLVPLQAIAKQNLTISLGGNFYELDVLLTQNVMSMNITRGTDVVVQGQRCVAGQLVIPYRKQEAGQGNFLFITSDDELPDYEEFGLTQFLFYASNEELAAVRPTPAGIKSTIPSMGTAVGAAVVRGVGAV